jgi:hypothetical protein
MRRRKPDRRKKPVQRPPEAAREPQQAEQRDGWSGWWGWLAAEVEILEFVSIDELLDADKPEEDKTDTPEQDQTLEDLRERAEAVRARLLNSVIKPDFLFDVLGVDPTTRETNRALWNEVWAELREIETNWKLPKFRPGRASKDTVDGARLIRAGFYRMCEKANIKDVPASLWRQSMSWWIGMVGATVDTVLESVSVEPADKEKGTE